MCLFQKENGCRNIFMTKSSQKNVLDAEIDLASQAALLPTKLMGMVINNAMLNVCMFNSIYNTLMALSLSWLEVQQPNQGGYLIIIKG